MRLCDEDFLQVLIRVKKCVAYYGNYLPKHCQTHIRHFFGLNKGVDQTFKCIKRIGSDRSHTGSLNHRMNELVGSSAETLWQSDEYQGVQHFLPDSMK